MKKVLFILIIIFLQKTFAQVEIIGSRDYGRIQFLNYDPVIPNKLYAATTGKHIVVSEDNSQNWEVLYSIPTADYVLITLLKIHSNTEISFSVKNPNSINNNKIYILNTATGLVTREYNVPIPSESEGTFVFGWDFYDENTVIAILNYDAEGPRSKVYYTNDGGITWDMIYYNFDHDTIWPNKVFISPSNPSKLFICRYAGYFPEHNGGLFVSEDAGQNWIEKLPNVDFGPIAFHPNNPDDILLGSWYASNTQNLYRSLDGGNNWDIVDQNWANDVYSIGILDIKYNPSNFNNILVTCTNDIVRTFNNFQTKEVINFQNNLENPNNYYFGFNASFNPFNGNQLLITNNDYPLESNDGGATVSKLDNPFFFSQLGQLNLFKNNNSKHLYYSVQNGYSHRNLNTLQETPYGILPPQIFPFTYNKFYCDEYLEGRIYGYYTSSQFTGSGISFSNDHGVNLTGISSPNLNLHAITSRPNNTNLLLCSMSDDYDISVLVEFDISDSNNIQQTSISIPTQGLVRDFHYDISNDNILWMALGRYIYKTINHGTTWELQSDGLESLVSSDKIYQISQNPLTPTQLTIATSRGIFTSINNGNSWLQLSTDEIQSVKHSDINNNHMVAITYDTEFTTFALRYSNDAGITWHQVPSEDLYFLNSDSESVAIDFINNTAEVYIGTIDLGVIKYTIELTTLGQNEIENNLNVFIHPNPTQNILNIQTQETITEVSVHDMLGKKVTVNQISSNKLDVSNLAKGMYILKVISENNKTLSSKFIKQ